MPSIVQLAPGRGELMRLACQIVRNVLAAWGLVWVLVTFTPLTSRYAEVLMGTWRTPDSGSLILLGADGPTRDVIGLASYWRATYTVWVWREGHFQNIVVSGGGGIASSIQAFLVCQGIPPDRILIEDQSTSTRENALYSAEILNRLPGPKVLLTSDFHVYRSVRAFRKAGVEVTPHPFPYALKRANQWLDRWPLFLELCVESGKILYYKARGWI